MSHRAHFRQDASEKPGTHSGEHQNGDSNAARNAFDPASLQTEAVRQVIDVLAEVAVDLCRSDTRTVADYAGAAARRNPALVLGGAAVAGFAATRLLKTSDDPVSIAPDVDPWSEEDHA